jgi:hypothetical protein
MADWRIQIEADLSLKDDFHRFIEEFSAIGLYDPFACKIYQSSLILSNRYRPVMTMRPDIRWAYATTMALIYESMTSHAVPRLHAEPAGTQYIRCIPQYIEYLKKGNL